MFKKLKYYIKRFINCVDAPNRSETFEEWLWLKLINDLNKINSKYLVLEFKKDKEFNDLTAYYFEYWMKNYEYKILTKEILQYTLKYIEEKVKKNKNLILEKSEEYIIIKKIK